MIKQLLINNFCKIAGFPFNIMSGNIFSDYEVHFHDFSELFIICSGSGIHIINEIEFPVLPGDVYMVSGDVSHGFKCERELEICNIAFLPDVILSNSEVLKKLPGFQALFILEPHYKSVLGYKNRLNLKSSSLKAAIKFIDTLQEEYDKKAPGCELAIQMYMTAFTIFLSREYDFRDQSENEIIGLARVLSYIENNYLNHIKLEDLSAIAKVSSRHLCRIFKAIYNNTPINYIIQLRIRYSCVLLLSTTQRISEIAFQSGFCDSNYFTREFKQLLKMSPREYRKQRLHTQ